MLQLILEKKIEKESVEIDNLAKKLSSCLDKKDSCLASQDYDLHYHLNINRVNILSVVEFKETDECLELGSEAGVLTSFIAKHCKKLVCVDPSKALSDVNLKRNNEVANLSVYVSDVLDYLDKHKDKFDKIFLLCSFDRIKSINSERSFENLLAQLKAHLKNGGQLFIATNNKYGIRYFNGEKETSNKKYFESIEENFTFVKLFSPVQLRRCLKKARFSSVYFYYPLPDYVFANQIFSEDFLPTQGMVSNLGHSIESDRAVLFNEDKAVETASSTGMFEYLTNSFLIRAEN